MTERCGDISRNQKPTTSTESKPRSATMAEQVRDTKWYRSETWMPAEGPTVYYAHSSSDAENKIIVSGRGIGLVWRGFVDPEELMVALGWAMVQHMALRMTGKPAPLGVEALPGDPEWEERDDG